MLVGNMSVPQGWTQAAPEIRDVAQALSTELASAPESAALSGREGSIFGQMALSSLAGRAVAATTTGSFGGTPMAASLGGVVTEADPAAATIFVIPAFED
jgi:hypothetical protein